MKVNTHRSTEAVSSNPQSFCNDFAWGTETLYAVGRFGHDWDICSLRFPEEILVHNPFAFNIDTRDVSHVSGDIVVPANTLVFVNLDCDYSYSPVLKMFSAGRMQPFAEETEVGIVIDEEALIAYLIPITDTKIGKTFSKFMDDVYKNFDLDYYKSQGYRVNLELRATNTPNEIFLLVNVYGNNGQYLFDDFRLNLTTTEDYISFIQNAIDQVITSQDN